MKKTEKNTLVLYGR